MRVSLTDLAAIMPRLPEGRATAYLDSLNEALARWEVNTPRRAAAFLAQIGHESADLRYMEEIWGPTLAQERYEPPSSVAARLGNVKPGDGKRYKGRGPIQLTGRANYRQCGGALGLDLESTPESAADPSVAFLVAGWYWSTRGLNALADLGDFRQITRRINGGQNGAADRERRHVVAQRVLGCLV